MNKIIKLTSDDGFVFEAYAAQPRSEIKGRVVVIQEIFGVNQHIREVCDAYAEEGYIAVAPALFDRVRPKIEFAYDIPEQQQEGVSIVTQQLDIKNTLADIQTTINYLAKEGKVAVLGFCFGGSMAWLAASTLNNLSCACGYYGGGIVKDIDKQPKVPTILHFGELDKMIPIEGVKKIQSAYPKLPIYIYNADHGFNCDHRSAYSEDDAIKAKERTLTFFNKYL